MTLPDDRGWASLLEARRNADTTFPAFVRFRFRKKDSGELRWTASRIWRAGDAGNVASYSAVVTDITDQIETAQALIESEERLRLAIEAGKMAVWEVDLNTGALTPSPELNHLIGLPPDAKPTVYDVRALYAPGEVARLAEEGASVLNAVIAIGLVFIRGFSRLARAAAAGVLRQPFILAAQAVGTRPLRIVRREVLPGIAGPVLAEAASAFSYALLFEAALSFLGLGAQPPEPSWGVMLNTGRGFLDQAPWLSLVPGGAVFLTVLGFHLIGDGLRDLYDQSLRD